VFREVWRGMSLDLKSSVVKSFVVFVVTFRYYIFVKYIFVGNIRFYVLLFNFMSESCVWRKCK
jgi:hypothetical protein